MAKDLERAKAFQKSLWEAAGREWSDASFTDDWVIAPYGADWDQWQMAGLMPIDFCPLCGDDDLSGGTTITKQFSELNVQIPHCKDCATRNSRYMPVSYKSTYETTAGCFILLFIVTGLLFCGWYFLLR